MKLVEKPGPFGCLVRSVPAKIVRGLIATLLILVIVAISLGFIDTYWAEKYEQGDYVVFRQGDPISDVSMDWPTSRGVSLVLDQVSHDTYLDIILSCGDTYRITFQNGDDSSYIIVTTSPGSSDSSESLLYRVPEHIVSAGYDRISIAPIGGDGQWALYHLDVLSDPDFGLYAEHTVVDFEIKVLEIAIEESDYARIEAKREEAIAYGILLAEDADYVPVTIRVDGREYDTQLRLKGDWTDHLEGDKWSFRIKVDDDCIMGMEKLSIQPPECRHNVGEYLIHEFYREQGGIAPRYEFVDVVINGVYKGVYALEEAFDKRMVENSNKREGAIVRFNEDILWTSRVYYPFGWMNRLIADVEPFNKSKTLKDDKLYDYVTYATYLLNATREGHLMARDAFDLDMCARYYATLDIFGAHHGSIWHNMRFYYNPVTARLEPITFDNLYWSYRDLSCAKSLSHVQDALFQDPAFVETYYATLFRMADSAKAFLDEQSQNITMYDYVLGRDGYAPFKPNVVHEQVAVIASLKEDQGIQCAVDGQALKADALRVDIVNNNILPVTIVDVTHNGRSLVFESEPIATEGQLALDNATGLSLDGLCINYTLPNLDRVFSETSFDVY